MLNRTLPALTLVLFACPADPAATDKDPADTSDTANPDTDSGSDPNCEIHLTSTSPASGAVNVYYRDELVLEFDGDAAAEAVISVTSSAGANVPLSVEWRSDNAQATVRPELEATTSYTLGVEICGASNQVPFQTSEIGVPLTITDEELTGRVFTFVLSDAEITDPAVLEAIDDTTFAVPLLFEVTVNAGTISLMGAIGGYTEEAILVQHPDYETFYFPAADFSETPHFEVATELVTITYSGREVPLNDFSLSGEFASDGSAIVMGEVITLVDTRHIGPVLGQPDTPNAACDFAASLGIYCETCPDGEDYCLHMAGEQITASYYEGVDLYDNPEM